jgi:hypothetical protein
MQPVLAREVALDPNSDRHAKTSRCSGEKNGSHTTKAMFGRHGFNPHVELFQTWIEWIPYLSLFPDVV